MNAAFDLAVVGAGPGGISAAAVAAEAGIQVCLLDSGPASGGQIWRGLTAESARYNPHGREFALWTARLAAAGCVVRHAVEVVDSPEHGMLHFADEDGAHRLAFSHLILATGARDRFLPFPGWTLPGVFGVGGLQALVKSGLDPAGKRIVVAGSGPLLLATAAELVRRGASVQAIVEQASRGALLRFGLTVLAHPDKLLEGAAYRRQTHTAPYQFGWWVARAVGENRVESVVLTDGRREQTLTCDWLACSYHLLPNLELPRLLGCRIEEGYVAVDGFQESSVSGVACVGELTGIGGMEKALLEGQIAGLAAAGRHAEARSLSPQRHKWARFAANLDRAFAPRPELRALPDAETVVCRCEDVSHSSLAGRRNWREAKLYTRCGMGPCQGRICGGSAEFLYGWEAAAVRPPIFPVKVSTLGAEVPVLPAPHP